MAYRSTGTEKKDEEAHETITEKLNGFLIGSPEHGLPFSQERKGVIIISLSLGWNMAIIVSSTNEEVRRSCFAI